MHDTIRPPTYPALEAEVYLSLERETMPPPSDDEQFGLELETLMGVE